MTELTNQNPGQRMTELILDLFAVNNRLLIEGDRLVAQLGLTSARWQVLGVIIEGGKRQPVSWIAREMDANRQNIQRIVNDLVADGLLAFEPNPHHQRAHLVVATAKGRSVFAQALQLKVPWTQKLAEGFSKDDLETAHKVVRDLRARLDGSGD